MLKNTFQAAVILVCLVVAALVVTIPAAPVYADYDDHEYMLQVLPGETQEDFQWDYALAWQMDAAPVPVPGAIWLIGSTFMALIGIRSWFPRSSVGTEKLYRISKFMK